MPDTTDEAERLRQELVSERLRRGWSLEQTARAIVRHLPRGTTLSRQSFHLWERGPTQLRLDQYIAWAHALGMRLDCDVVPAQEDLTIVRVPGGVVELVKELAALDDRDRGLVSALVLRLRD